MYITAGQRDFAKNPIYPNSKESEKKGTGSLGGEVGRNSVGVQNRDSSHLCTAGARLRQKKKTLRGTLSRSDSLPKDCRRDQTRRKGRNSILHELGPLDLEAIGKGCGRNRSVKMERHGRKTARTKGKSPRKHLLTTIGALEQ